MAGSPWRVVWILVWMIGLPRLYGQEKTQPIATAEWVQMLHQGSVEERIRAAQALGELRAIDAVADLGQALGDQEPKVRFHVIRALSQLRDPRAEPFLGRALNDPETTNRMEALRAVYGYYLGEPISSGLHQVRNLMLFRQMRLEKTPWKQVDPQVTAALQSWLGTEDESWRIRAIQAIEHLWIYDLTDDLIPLLNSKPSRNLIFAVFRTLGNLQACRELAGLTPWIHHEDTSIMEHATWAIAQCGSRLPEISETLYRAYQQEPDVARQRIYFRALSQVGARQAIPLFVQGLKSKDELIRRWSAAGLGRAQAQSHIYDVALAFLQEKDEKTRLGMSYALFLLGRKEHAVRLIDAVHQGGEMRELAASYLLESQVRTFPEVFRIMADRDEETQVEILKIAAHGDNAALLPYLENLMNSRDETLAVAAFEALKQVRQALKLRAAYMTAP